ncbi:DUF2490 domain-containing protein [Aestuariibaculum sp. YM273]|uniref:DUF2490 domain-containing protein n=1 Tax=Aestuariibaculum sp. YM273 TaxID=3070659 RepID=UPI0027DDD11D|nr:DUF2490 domain-containing protein [Aestuariibaculum sp. YM273]WMI66394.1 DUF2490 domain-containing protein [Aestuariibaculum sp. YM273]
MKLKYLFLYIGLSCFIHTIKAQEQDHSGILGETSFVLNYSATSNYNISFTSRSRYFLFENKTFGFQQQQLDIFHMSTFTLSSSNRIGVGLYYRHRDVFESGSDELRFMQQFKYQKHKARVSFGHRFRTEQRILESKTIFRQRYRFSANFPISGHNEDVEAPYVLCYFEGLLSLSKPDAPEIDQRTAVYLGWHFGKQLKFKTGIEYRLERFNLTSRNYLFFLNTLSLSI